VFDKYFSELCAQHPTLELLARPSEPLSHGCIKAMPLTCRRRRRPGRRADHFRFIIYLCSTICVCDSTRNRRLLSRQLVSQVSEAKQPRSMARSAQAVSALDTSFQHKNHICESVAAPIFVLHVSEAKQARSMVRSAQTIPSQRIQLQAESRMEQPESGGVNHANILLQVSEAKQARSMARSAQADQLADAARLLIRSLAGAHCRRHVCRCLRGDLCLRLATSSTLLCCLQWRSACASRCQPGRALRGAATVDATPRHSAGLEAYDGTNSFRLSGSFSESYHVGCAGAAPPGSSQHSSGGAAAVLWPAALRLLVAALRLTNDRRQRGFTGAVLQVLLAPIMVVSQDVVTVACCRVPGAGCRVPAVSRALCYNLGHLPVRSATILSGTGAGAAAAAFSSGSARRRRRRRAAAAAGGGPADAVGGSPGRRRGRRRRRVSADSGRQCKCGRSGSFPGHRVLGARRRGHAAPQQVASIAVWQELQNRCRLHHMQGFAEAYQHSGLN